MFYELEFIETHFAFVHMQLCVTCSEMLKQSMTELNATTSELEKKLDASDEDSKCTVNYKQASI